MSSGRGGQTRSAARNLSIASGIYNAAKQKDIREQRNDSDVRSTHRNCGTRLDYSKPGSARSKFSPTFPSDRATQELKVTYFPIEQVHPAGRVLQTGAVVAIYAWLKGECWQGSIDRKAGRRFDNMGMGMGMDCSSMDADQKINQTYLCTLLEHGRCTSSMCTFGKAKFGLQISNLVRVALKTFHEPSAFVLVMGIPRTCICTAVCTSFINRRNTDSTRRCK